MNPIKAGEAIIAIGEAVAPKTVQVAEEAAQALLRDTPFGRSLEAATRVGVKVAPSVSEEAADLLARAQKPVAELLPVASKNDPGIVFFTIWNYWGPHDSTPWPQAVHDLLSKTVRKLDGKD